MTEPTFTTATKAPAVACRLDQPVRPRAWALFAANGNYRLWSTEREEVERLAAEAGAPVVPLYALSDDDVAAVNKRRAGKEWKRQRDLKACQCDHNEYCRHCWPEDFRPGGMWHGLGA